MTALEKLKKKNSDGKFICVGLDSDIDKIPAHLKKFDDPVLEFNKELIEATSAYAAAYKLNFAFYERNGYKGLITLERTLSFIPGDIMIVADAKRGDIGNTSEMYSKAILQNMNFDSITINPYMGGDSVLPFLKDHSKLIFILALTSNPGAEDFEKLEIQNGVFLFQKIIEKVKTWNTNNNCGIVFGATKLEELKDNIKNFGNLPVLLPGVGAQGGSLEDVIKAFKSFKRSEYIINISRGIIYKSSERNFAEEAKKEIIKLNETINRLLID